MANMSKNGTTGKYELNITPSASAQTKTLKVGGNYCDADIDVKVATDSNLIASNIRSGITIFGVLGTLQEALDVADSIAYTGVGNSCFTVYQTDGSYYGRSGWATYLICNHGDGSSYYHQMIAMPFWGTPCYQRMENGSLTGWKDFITDENFDSKMATYISNHSYDGTYNIL